jgi:hypothetical protein
MAFTVQDFRSRLVFGGARANLFEVILPFPVVSGGVQNGELFSFMCKAASLPGSEVGTITVPYFGRQIKVPGDRQFPQWDVTIINDEGFQLRDTFERWMNALNSHFGNLRDPQAKTTGGYQVDATVRQYGKTGDIIKEYDMIGCWPSSVTPIDTTWDQNESIEEFQVTFQYQWWESNTTT